MFELVKDSTQASYNEQYRRNDGRIEAYRREVEQGLSGLGFGGGKVMDVATGNLVDAPTADTSGIDERLTKLYAEYEKLGTKINTMNEDPTKLYAPFQMNYMLENPFTRERFGQGMLDAIEMTGEYTQTVRTQDRAAAAQPAAPPADPLGEVEEAIPDQEEQSQSPSTPLRDALAETITTPTPTDEERIVDQGSRADVPDQALADLNVASFDLLSDLGVNPMQGTTLESLAVRNPDQLIDDLFNVQGFKNIVQESDLIQEGRLREGFRGQSRKDIEPGKRRGVDSSNIPILMTLQIADMQILEELSGETNNPVADLILEAEEKGVRFNEFNYKDQVILPAIQRSVQTNQSPDQTIIRTSNQNGQRQASPGLATSGDPERLAMDKYILLEDNIDQYLSNNAIGQEYKKNRKAELSTILGL